MSPPELTTMMTSVVASGTGTAAQMDGITVAGKTGTAQHAPGAAPHAWFISFAPAENPTVAVAVVVERAAAGNEASGVTAARSPRPSWKRCSDDPDDRKATMSEQARLLGGRYEAGELVGGMAEVHWGRPAPEAPGRHQDVAPATSRDASFLTRFRRGPVQRRPQPRLDRRGSRLRRGPGRGLAWPAAQCPPFIVGRSTSRARPCARSSTSKQADQQRGCPDHRGRPTLPPTCTGWASSTGDIAGER